MRDCAGGVVRRMVELVLYVLQNGRRLAPLIVGEFVPDHLRHDHVDDIVAAQRFKSAK